MSEHIQFADNKETVEPVKGTVGLRTQLPGQQTTVSALAKATGGIKAGKLVTTAKG